MTYPKEIVTLEKITEDGEETQVSTTVNNEYEEKAVEAALTFMNAFNRADADGVRAVINYPHARIGANGKLIIANSPEDMISAEGFKRFQEEYGWNRSCWDYREVIKSSPEKVHTNLQFSRYRKDGSKIGEFPSFWVITNQDGHWAIQMRSSFAP